MRRSAEMLINGIAEYRSHAERRIAALETRCENFKYQGELRLRQKIALTRDRDAAHKRLAAMVKDTDIMHVSKRRKKTAVRRNYTTRGGYQIALCRNTGHVSAKSILAILEGSVQGPTETSVANWEINLGASIQVFL